MEPSRSWTRVARATPSKAQIEDELETRTCRYHFYFRRWPIGFKRTHQCAARRNENHRCLAWFCHAGRAIGGGARCATACARSFAHRGSDRRKRIRRNAAPDVATRGGIAEPGKDRDDSHLARPTGAASCRTNADQIDNRDLRRDRRATNSAGRHADSDVASGADGLGNHVHQRQGTKSARCDRVHRRAWRECRRGNASSRGRARNAEVFSGMGQRGLRDGRRRGNLRDWSRGDGILSRRRFLERGAADVPEEQTKTVSSRVAIA